MLFFGEDEDIGRKFELMYVFVRPYAMRAWRGTSTEVCCRILFLFIGQGVHKLIVGLHTFLTTYS